MPDDSLTKDEEETLEERQAAQETNALGIINFPYSATKSVLTSDSDKVQANEHTSSELNTYTAEQEVEKRKKLMGKSWMTDFDNFNDELNYDDDSDDSWKVNYGTPDPNSEISNVPCGGCGALLHCKVIKV